MPILRIIILDEEWHKGDKSISTGVFPLFTTVKDVSQAHPSWGGG
jgi:hypothetical protein